MSATGWAWAALALYLAGLVLAFGVRTWAQISSTGSSGFHGISGRPAHEAVPGRYRLITVSTRCAGSRRAPPRRSA